VDVTMNMHISGGRGDGTGWPEVGQTLTVGPDEGAALVAAGIASPAAVQAAEALQAAEAPAKVSRKTTSK
jgi:hypothetical protein